MTERKSPLQCYRCQAPATLDETRCHNCGLPLDWRMFEDLRAIEFLLQRVEQWAAEGVVSPSQAQRMRHEAAFNRDRMRATLERKSREVRRLMPKYRLDFPEAAPAVAAAPPRFVPQGPPRFTPPARQPFPPRQVPAGQPDEPVFQEPPAPVTPAEPRRSVIDVLVDLGTVRLMLYTGALLLAVGVTIWLRDTLRVQLQRPAIQAGLLLTFTLLALGSGVALVRRAANRDETRLIGRGILLLGSLLLPLNPWFWLRAGLIEDRGNAWIVGLVSCVVSLTIAFGLGDRVFVFLSYAAALLTGWLLTYKITGGAAPGVYAIVISAVSLLYLHAERPIASAGQGRRWENFGGPFFLCGHIGLAITVVFHTGTVQYLPPGFLAAFKHFDPAGVSLWQGVGVAALASWAYLYSAARRELTGFTYLGIWAAFLTAILAMRAAELPHEGWLLAFGGLAIITAGLGIALQARPLWGPPLWQSARVFAVISTVVASIVALPYSWSLNEVPWYAMLGVALTAATFGLRAMREGDASDSVFGVLLCAFVAVYILRESGLAWIDADFGLAVLVGLACLATARIGQERAGLRTGIWLGLTGVLALLALAGAYWAVRSTDELSFRALPLTLALVFAFGTAGWTGPTMLARRMLYSIGAFFGQWAVLMTGVAARKHYDFNERYLVFTLAPAPIVLLGIWIALRQKVSDSCSDLASVVRAWTSVAAAFGALFAPFLYSDASLYKPAGFVFGAAMLLLAAAPFALAAIQRTGAVAIVEGSLALLLGLAAWHGVFDGFSSLLDPRYTWLTVSVGMSLLPFAMRGLSAALAERIHAIALPAQAFSVFSATFYLISSAGTLTDDFLTRPFHDRLAFIQLGLVLGSFGVWRLSAGRYQFLWMLQALAGWGCASVGLLRVATYYEPVAVGIIAAGAVTLAIAGMRARRDDAATSFASTILGHGLIAIAVLFALGQIEPLPQIPWAFVAICATVVLAYVSAAVSGVRDSSFDHRHRDLAAAAVLATYVAALSAWGFTTIPQLIEPFAIGLVVAVTAVIVVPDEWVRRDGRVIVHIAMIGCATLFLTCLLERDSPAGLLGDVSWSWLAAARIATEIAVFYAIASALRDPVSVLGALSASSIAILAVCEHFEAGWAVHVLIFAAIGTALALVARGLGERAEWIRSVLEVTGQVIFAIAAGIACVLVLADLGVGSTRLTMPVVAFATLTACAWLLARTDGVPERKAVFRLVWIALCVATYGIFGLRLGFHPWNESAFYTLPAGALLVVLGSLASRREEGASIQALLWLGSLLAVAPMLTHALENRFIREVSPVGYDAATLTVSLVLVATGVLLQMRAPSIAGAVAAAIDLFVVAFSQIQWEEVPLFIYLTALGGALFGASWLLLYRRDALLRLRDRLRERREAFRRWH